MSLILAAIAVLGVITTAGSGITIAVLNNNGAKARADASAAREAVLEVARDARAAADRLALVTEMTANRTSGKLDTIHVLVNNRLTLALAATASLKRKLGIDLLPEEMQAEIDAVSIHELSRVAQIGADTESATQLAEDLDRAKTETDKTNGSLGS